MPLPADERLSEHFFLSEFTCKCGCGFDAIDRRLVEELQVVRTALHAPLYILSGCRCRNHNRAVGGTPNSQHLLGLAANVTWGGNLLDLYDALNNQPCIFCGAIGLYPTRHFVHVDVRENDAKGLRWIGGF